MRPTAGDISYIIEDMQKLSKYEPDSAFFGTGSGSEALGAAADLCLTYMTANKPQIAVSPKTRPDGYTPELREPYIMRSPDQFGPNIPSRNSFGNHKIVPSTYHKCGVMAHSD